LKLTLGEIAQAVNGKLTDESNKNGWVSGLFLDSREAAPGRMFVAIKGEKTDAHIFVNTVIEKGCFALIDNPDYLTDNAVLVGNTRNALQTLALKYRTERLSSTKVIAVTGSVGKTSTKDMVALAVSAGMTVGKTQDNKNSQIGLPLTILEAEPVNRALILEAGMSEEGEMSRLSEIARPDIAMITNIGYSHIETLGCRENICAQKLAIADHMPKEGVLILNGDESLLRGYNGYARRIYCSVNDSNSDCYASDIKQEDDSTRFIAHVLGKTVEVSLKALGKHIVANALFALTAAVLLNVDIAQAAKKLATFKSSGLRQRIYEKDGYTIIADCYNAAPESMAAALSVLGTKSGRKIAVLGDMLELGDYALQLHEEVGQLVLENKTDILVTFGSLAKHIAFYAGGKIEVYSFEENEYDKAAGLLKALIKPGDTVLYKASNRMNLSKLINLV